MTIFWGNRGLPYYNSLWIGSDFFLVGYLFKNYIIFSFYIFVATKNVEQQMFPSLLFCCCCLIRSSRCIKSEYGVRNRTSDFYLIQIRIQGIFGDSGYVSRPLLSSRSLQPFTKNISSKLCNFSFMKSFLENLSQGFLFSLSIQIWNICFFLPGSL